MTTSFLYDDADVVLDRGSDGSAVEYLNGPGVDDKLRQTSAGTGALYFLQDHLGSTAVLTNAGGGVVERLQYEAFGESAGSSLTRYGFTGRERDAATGLLHYRARWYDPQQGRFISEDPLGFEGGLNLYRYASNDPVNFIDPFGMQDGPANQNSGFLSLQRSYWQGVGRGVVNGVVGTVQTAAGLVTQPRETVRAIGEDLSMRARTMYDVARHPMQAKEAITDAIIELGPEAAMGILGDAGGQVIAYKAINSGARQTCNSVKRGLQSRWTRKHIMGGIPATGQNIGRGVQLFGGRLKYMKHEAHKHAHTKPHHQIEIGRQKFRHPTGTKPWKWTRGKF